MLELSDTLIICTVALIWLMRTMEKVNNLLGLMKDATLTDVTCMEELLQRLIKNDVFEK